MAQSKKLKFKRSLGEHPFTREGYRLATLEEVSSFKENIIREGLPPVKQDLNSSYGVVEDLRLLDGYAIYNSDQKSLHVRPDFNGICRWKVVVKEKELGEAKKLEESLHEWRTKSSSLYSENNRSVLRKDVYRGIFLSQSARVVALQLAAYHYDVEVLFWLLADTLMDPDELERFKGAFDDMFDRCSGSFIDVVRCLLSSSFPFHLPLQEDLHGNTVVDYLIKLAKECSKEEDTWYVMGFIELLVNIYQLDIVVWQNSKGLSLIDLAESEQLIYLFTKLLAVSQSIKHPKIKLHFEKVLAEAINRGYGSLVQMLLESEDELAHIPTDVFWHFLRDAALKNQVVWFQMLLDFISKTPIRVDRGSHQVGIDKAVVIRKRDKYERNLLHYAAEASTAEIAEHLLESSASSLDLVFSTDFYGRTPLHIAASKNNIGLVTRLKVILGNDKFLKYLQQTDSFGRTPLHMAAKGGHINTIKFLLDHGSNPLKERDARGKTALHYAALAKHHKTAQSICQILLLNCEPSLLLWANAPGIGTADDMEEVHPSIKEYLREQKEDVKKVNLLRQAVLIEQVEMACELLNRGAKMADIYDESWKKILSKKQEVALENVINEFNRMKEQGRDRPTMEDRLGRSLLAGGLASLFLNRFIDSPITVGVSGEWGMGKSSLMVQTEKILLLTSAQLTFPNLLPLEEFCGAREITFCKRGKRMYEKIKQGAAKEIAKYFPGTKLEKQNPLIHMLKEYQPEYDSVYKSLACMDTRQLLQSNVERSSSEHQEYAFSEVPRILTVQYNAWHYTDEHQAWAGLAVSITKEIEKAMTKEQWLSTCWRYSWNKNKTHIWLYVFLPCLLATFLSGWVAWGAWILLSQAKFQDLKYGSIPITMIIIVWVVTRSITSVVIPVSTQMMGYMTSPNHTSHLGYQEEVICDINFLKSELGKRSYRFFSFILGKWCWNWFGLFADYVENTSIVKFTPASEGQLRIITFVDDLDRSEEKVVLKVLSAISLVLAECKINVVLGTDKKMIERAMRRNFEDLNERDIAEKFICKIIQVPLSLPDSTKEEMQTFLADQLGWKSKAQWKSSVADYEDPNYSTSDNSDEEEENVSNQNGETKLDIKCCIKDGTRCNGIMKRIFDYIQRCFSFCKKNSNANSVVEKLPLSKEIQIARTMALLKCNGDEADIFLRLMEFATGNRKLPRECKRLLNYHRLAWNVLSNSGAVYNLPTWKAELVAWIFICWQWKHQLNILIKGWHEHAKVEGNHAEDEDESSVAWHGPSLGEIVEQYVKKQGSKQGSGKPEGSSTAKRNENMVEVKGTLIENNLRLYALGHYEDSLEKDEKQESWHKLQDALKIQDVSMKGIQLFQQFRLHCETDHLPWPLPKSRSNQTEPDGRK